MYICTMSGNYGPTKEYYGYGDNINEIGYNELTPIEKLNFTLDAEESFVPKVSFQSSQNIIFDVSDIIETIIESDPHTASDNSSNDFGGGDFGGGGAGSDY